MASWDDFKREQRGADAAKDDDIAETCMRVFGSADGRDLLKHLYATYVDRRCRPGATEAELREAEAQRRLVHDLEKLRDEGAQRVKDRTKT